MANSTSSVCALGHLLQCQQCSVQLGTDGLLVHAAADEDNLLRKQHDDALLRHHGISIFAPMMRLDCIPAGDRPIQWPCQSPPGWWPAPPHWRATRCQALPPTC